ncbi:hypothetical protein FH972_015137 [Carpinus fangiana]|uniref:Uncharacterized protein n=1 Tax=Carpinus fangiana TaxID=176857 RepID=A0A5N6RFA7_9ROSI|nr:hypothetical protein FH972_015137 [Carpinus fangiana]
MENGKKENEKRVEEETISPKAIDRVSKEAKILKRDGGKRKRGVERESKGGKQRKVSLLPWQQI